MIRQAKHAKQGDQGDQNHQGHPDHPDHGATPVEEEGGPPTARLAPRLALRAGKRGNNEGSITRRADGRWHARVSLEEGKRKHFYGKTRQEVAAKLTAALRDRDQGLPLVRDERQTLAQYLEGWLTTMRANVRPRTWQRYEQYVRLHTVPQLGRVALLKLTAQQIESLYANRLEAGCAPSSVKHLHTLLHKALEDALRLGLVQRNVVDLARAPRAGRSEMRVLSLEQVKTLLRVARGDRFEALYVLAVTTGMRRGELLALKWRDVDLGSELDVDHSVANRSASGQAARSGQPALQVRATLQKTKGGFVFAEPKSAHSRRRIALTAAAAKALSRHRARQEQERLALGPEWEEQDLVFCTHQGRPLIGSNVLNQNFHPLLKRAGLPRIRFHDLRHSCATLLLLRGVHPKVVSELLGHASVSLTLDVYSHILPDMQREATTALDLMLLSDNEDNAGG